MPAIMNGANEVAVEAFLADRIPFGRISRLVEDVMLAVPVCSKPSIDDVFEADAKARRAARALLSK